MARICKVCSHPDTEKIEHDIVANIPHTQIASKYGIKHLSVRYHSEHHLPEKLVQAVADEKSSHAENILEGINDLLDRTKKIMNGASDKGYGRLELEAIRESRSIFELLSKIAVKLAEYKHDAEMEVKEAETGPKTLADLYSEERDQDGRLGLGRLQAMSEAGSVLTLKEAKEYQRIQMKLMAGVDEQWLTTEEQQDLEDYQRMQGYSAPNDVKKGDEEPPETRPLRVKQNKNIQKMGRQPDQFNKPKIKIKRKPEPDDLDLELDDLDDFDDLSFNDEVPPEVEKQRANQWKGAYRPDW